MLTRIFLKKIKAKKESNKLNTKDWTLFSLVVLFIFAMGVVNGDEEDVKYYSKSIKSDVDSYFEDIRSKVENLRDWGEQWKALAKDLFNELLEIDSDNTIDSYLSYKALEKIKEHLKNQ